jgi:hypothetical protein
LTFEIEINGTARTVSVERAGAAGRFRVSIDGEPAIVDAERVGEFGMSLLFPGTRRGAAAVQLAPGAAHGELIAHMAGRTVPVTGSTGAAPAAARRTPAARRTASRRWSRQCRGASSACWWPRAIASRRASRWPSSRR